VLYADRITDSMREAISTTERRRLTQIKYNEENNITPITITKNVADILGRLRSESAPEPSNKVHGISSLETIASDDLNLEIARVEDAMLQAAAELRFEEAAALRDYLHTLQIQGLGEDLRRLELDA
jgi:excinuclease ABC subunit B